MKRETIREIFNVLLVIVILGFGYLAACPVAAKASSNSIPITSDGGRYFAGSNATAMKVGDKVVLSTWIESTYMGKDITGTKNVFKATISAPKFIDDLYHG
jgi:UDP-N-acetylglucosamine:LPS N-acetylglucosamine transferase